MVVWEVGGWTGEKEILIKEYKCSLRKNRFYYSIVLNNDNTELWYCTELMIVTIINNNVLYILILLKE